MELRPSEGTNHIHVDRSGMLHTEQGTGIEGASIVRGCLLKEIMFEQRTELSEEVNSAQSLGKSMYKGRGNSKYKGPEVGPV